MNTESETISRLVYQLTKLPGVGKRTAMRYAYKIIEMDKAEAKQFIDSIIEVREKVRECSVCGNFTDEEVCDICKYRDKSVILVVAEPKDITTFEKMNSFKGVYHVLHGTISPLRHVSTGDIRIKELLERVADGINEVILGLSSDVEGEATAMYISRLLKPLGIKVTRLAFGIPIGQDIEYADEVTLSRAFSERKTL